MDNDTNILGIVKGVPGGRSETDTSHAAVAVARDGSGWSSNPYRPEFSLADPELAAPSYRGWADRERDGKREARQ